MTAHVEGKTIGALEAGETRPRIARLARLTLIIGGAGAAAIGPLLVSGYRHLLQAHELLGDVSILSLWTLAVVGWRSGVAGWKVVLAALGGLIALSLGGAQKLPYGPSLHAATQVLHVATSIGVMVGGMLLARAVPRARPAASAPGTLAAAAAEFLARKRLAVTGVSRNSDGGHGSNTVYRRLKERDRAGHGRD